MGWFKKLANMARQSNNTASSRLSGYSGSSSYTNNDEYEEDEELVACVCSNCVHFTTVGFCYCHGVHLDELDNQFDCHTYGCEHFKY